MIDLYLDAFDGVTRERLVLMRQVLCEAVPDGEETLSYAIPTLDLNGRHVVHFAGFAKHVGLYPTPHGIAAFEAELAAYPQGKGSVQFPHDRPLPVELIGRIGRHLAERARAQPPKKKRARVATSQP